MNSMQCAVIILLNYGYSVVRLEVCNRSLLFLGKFDSSWGPEFQRFSGLGFKVCFLVYKVVIFLCYSAKNKFQGVK